MSKEKKLVSVVIASYNHKNYVEKSIQSIVNQDYYPIELIVIDDGSKDGSGDYLESLQDIYKFRLIRKKNGGLVSVINMAISEVKGEYVIFHASDDKSLPGRIAGQVDVLERYHNAAFVSGNVKFIRENGDFKGTLFKITGGEKELNFDDLFLNRFKVSSVSTMYRTSALKKMGSISDEYIAEDPQIFFRLTSLGFSWIQWSGDPVIVYRMLHSSQSRTKMPILIEQNLKLLHEYSNHKSFKKAYKKLRVCQISALAESDKIKALKHIKSGNFNYFSVSFIKAILKIFIPKKYHYLFKRAGKCVSCN